MTHRNRSCWIGLTFFASALLLAGCTSDGHFRFLGYTTEPNYDSTIRTVYVPVAKNVTFRRGLEDYLTRAVIREIINKTPYMIASCRENADTELCLKIITRGKNMIIPTPTNQIRQSEVNMGVEVVWKDLRPGRTGEVLSNPRAALTREPPLPGMEPVPPAPAMPILLLPVATYEPELGGSTQTAEKQVIDRVAVQIVSMMEKGW
jgi:hypothetical protein